MTKITVLPTFLINWLEDNGFEFTDCEHPDSAELDRSCLTYQKGGAVLFIECYKEGITEVYPFGGKNCLYINTETTEEEFLQGVVNLGK